MKNIFIFILVSIVMSSVLTAQTLNLNDAYNTSLQSFSPLGEAAEYGSTASGGYQNGTYFSLAVGYGNSYGGLGIRAQSRFGGILGFGLHAGVGYFPAATTETNGNATKLEGSVLYSIGAKFFMYKSLYLDAQYGAFGSADREEFVTSTYYSGSYHYSYYSIEEKKGLLYGPTIMFGGDFIFGKHFGFNAGLGASFNMNNDFKDDYKTMVALDLGFVFKF
jgi:hypothetical protein